MAISIALVMAVSFSLGDPRTRYVYSVQHKDLVLCLLRWLVGWSCEFLPCSVCSLENGAGALPLYVKEVTCDCSFLCPSQVRFPRWTCFQQFPWEAVAWDSACLTWGSK